MDIPVVQNPSVPPPAKVIAAQAETPKPDKPPGWWNLPNLSGSLAGVCKAVQDSPEVPSHWKTAIIEDLKARCGSEFNFVYLDAHCYVERGNTVVHYHATPDKKLL